MVKRVCVSVLVFLGIAGIASPALACGGLIGPSGAVNLTKTTTLAAHHDGVEHYVTSFEYAGGGGEFGSIVPLPGMPTKVEEGGAWTLQRLLQETTPQPEAAAVSAASSDTDRAASAREVYKTRIDALDITVLEGGGRAVGIWAADHGFRLPPDAPEVLDFYADRSPFFLAAVFDPEAAEERGQRVGDGTPVHVTIPLRSPWVPLRILGLGKQATERVEADVYLLTDSVPNLLPGTGEAAGAGYEIERQVPASTDLLSDLRSDKGMGWLPGSGMTLTHLVVDSAAATLRYDLAINVSGASPSRTRAGLPPLATPRPTPPPTQQPTPAATTSPTPRATLLATADPASSRSGWLLGSASVFAGLAAVAAWTLRRRAGA
jgi:hypothetical protein